jgi:hypothetical protein
MWEFGLCSGTNALLTSHPLSLFIDLRPPLLAVKGSLRRAQTARP